MSELRLFLLQRLSAVALAVLVAGHLGGIILFSHGGLSAAEIVRRAHSSFVWPALYGLFVLAAATHGAIGLRAIGRELWRGSRRLPDLVGGAAWGLLLLLGIRAVSWIL